VRSATPSGQNQSRRLDLHQHRAVYRTAAFLFGHVGTPTALTPGPSPTSRARGAAQQAGVRGFEPRWAALETASSPRRTLLYPPPTL
jgi:hypothetical protein